MKKIPLSRGLEAIVDDEDYDVLIKWKWYASPVGNTAYAVRNAKRTRKEKNMHVYMHRFIMRAMPGSSVDHIDGNGLNNTRKNMRLCSHGENMFNHRISKRNKSGFKGVSWCERDKSWRAHISKKGVEKRSLGSYKTKEEAARAYDIAAIELHGEFARLNFPNE